MRRKKPYEGLCLFVMGGVWRISIARRNGAVWETLDVSRIFSSLDELRAQLQLGNVMATSVTLTPNGERCLISTSKRRGLVRTEGRDMVKVLKGRFSAHDGVPIRWRWDIRQYN